MISYGSDLGARGWVIDLDGVISAAGGRDGASHNNRLDGREVGGIRQERD